jgi:hypothetical protein
MYASTSQHEHRSNLACEFPRSILDVPTQNPYSSLFSSKRCQPTAKRAVMYSACTKIVRLVSYESKRKLTRARLAAPTTPRRAGTAGFSEIEKRIITGDSSVNVVMKYEMLSCQGASRQSMNPPEIRCQPNPAISLRQTYCVHRPPFLQTRLCLGILR